MQENPKGAGTSRDYKGKTKGVCLLCVGLIRLINPTTKLDVTKDFTRNPKDSLLNQIKTLSNIEKGKVYVKVFEEKTNNKLFGKIRQ